MKLSFLLLISLFFNIFALANHQSLFIFQEYKSSFKNDTAGMNIAHQFIACLHQKSGPILISKNIWNHILERKERFENEWSVKKDILSLIDEVNSFLTYSSSLKSINQKMNQSWYQKKYPQLSNLDDEKHKEVMFDFLCSNIFEFVSNWNVYQVDSYLLFVMQQDDIFFKKENLLKITDITKTTFKEDSRSFYLVPVLSKTLKKEFIWSFYISGHGDHADSDSFVETIVGMPLKHFKNFIVFLDKDIKTNLLVYSSCYGSGINLIEPYQSIDEYKNLSFTIITTCLTDAPVYMYGSASGLLLPPYDQNIVLKEKDIKHNKLYWSFVQDFSNFKKLALEKNRYSDLAQAIMPYQECKGSICHLSQLENVPLIKRKKELFFVPLDSTYIDFVIHNSSETKTVENKSGLLWYIKQYKGTIKVDHSYPQYINMIPGDGVIWAKRLEIKNSNLDDFILKSFFSIEDMHGVKVFIFDTIEFLDNNFKKIELKNCMIIPKSSWIPRQFLNDKQLGVCFYQYNKAWHCLHIMPEGKTQFHSKISSSQFITLIKLWKLLRKESKLYHFLDALDLIFSYKKRQESYQEILKLCKAEEICS